MHLLTLITAVNAARHTVRCYPPEHPVICSTFQRIIKAYQPLFELRDEVVIGVTRKALMLDGHFVDIGNSLCADFAASLFHHGIGVVVISSGTQINDVRSLVEVLALRQEDVLRRGGIETVWGERKSHGIVLMPIRYHLFQAVEVPEIDGAKPSDMPEGEGWEQFLRDLTSAPRGVKTTALLPQSLFRAEWCENVDDVEAAQQWRDDSHPRELDDLEAEAVEAAMDRVLLLFLDSYPNKDDGEVLERQLARAIRTHIAAGRYARCSSLLKQSRGRIVRWLPWKEVLSELLHGMELRGKDLYPEVRNIINEAGTPLLPHLLHRLAQEKTMALRRFIMGCIADLGNEGKEQLLVALMDSRWYLVRNVVLILRQMKDPSTIPFIRPLLHHRKEVVRQEALKTLLQLGDTRAYGKVVQDLHDTNPAARLAALRLCCGCASSRVFNEVADLALKFAVTRQAYQEREAAVATLAESGRPETVAIMTQILESRNLLAPRRHLQLKTQSLLLMEKYFPGSVEAVASKLTTEAGKLGTTASAVLIRVRQTQA